MAGRNQAGDDLQRHAYAVTDMLQQLKLASQRSQGSAQSIHGRGRGDWHYRGQTKKSRNHRGRSHGHYWEMRSAHQNPYNQRPPQNRFYTECMQSPRQRLHPQQRSSYSHWREYPHEDQDSCAESFSYNREKSRYDGEDTLSPHQLISSLTEFPDFTASLLQLMEKNQFSPSAVRSVVSMHQQVFRLDGEKLTLKPQVSLCMDYLSGDGCQNRSACRSFHICPEFISNTCNNKNCFLGHSWSTNHNKAHLESMFLKQLSTQQLHKLFKDLGECKMSQDLLGICVSYNTEGCKQENCMELHVCFEFVVGYTKCRKKDCKLNHNILNQSCCKLLMMHNLSINETPRDVTIALLSANPAISDKYKEAKQKDDSLFQESSSDSTAATESMDPNEKEQLGNENECKNEDEVSSEGSDSKEISVENESEEYSDVTSGSDGENSETDSMKDVDLTGIPGQQKTKRNDRIVKLTENSKVAVNLTPQRTLWSHYPHGNVAIPEICYYSVERMCENEANGCQRLHCTQHFHWQVSEHGKLWLNLGCEHITFLERAFCNIASDGVDLPRLDPSTVGYSAHGLLILMGRDTWHADFKTMNLTNSTDTKKLLIRRLCTENIDGQVIKAATFVWSFLDKNNRWVRYGNVDTVGEKDLVSSVTSEDIEKHFFQTPSIPLTFSNSKFSYVLDFNTMEQTNKKTKVRREVRRRPEYHLKEENTVEGEDKDREFPLTWDPMKPEDRMQRILLSSSSSEYQTVVNLLAGKLSSSSVTKIERVQNPFLWRALQNKIKEMTTVYGDLSKVDVRQVFHGTCHSVVPSICIENFDWRLHGSSSGQLYGRGTYFSTDAKYSYNYCQADSAGNKYMFVARVAVGAITAGNSNMPRPPINAATNAPFDSTVDNVSNFTIIVKYDKQEYYPEYILTLT